VHMIRNSVDHGLENAADRKAAGKDESGTVTLEAGQEGGEILITIRDDGRGMSREKILGKAIEKKLVEGDGSNLTDNEVFQFIFQPGFSTAEAITATSGRGVGMDVVKSNIDKLGGRIYISSQQGKGSEIILRIPLTLSIIEGMMVQVGASLFILPLTTVRESISAKKENVFTLVGGQEMFMLRGKALPILRTANLFGIPGSFKNITDGLLIHLESRGMSFCLAVDNLLGQRQTVVKSIPSFMGEIPGISSCSILDNGEIALILDVASLGGKMDHADNSHGQQELQGNGSRKAAA
jgi:two-component system, chemotaxis family, sensor kinase CheA